MNGKGSIQDIWTTDRPLIEKMKATEENRFTSSNESRDTDSDSSSRGSFTALPLEFRPDFIKKRSPIIRKDTKNKLNPSNRSNNPSIENSQRVSKESNSKTTQNKSSARREKDETLSIQNKISNKSFMERPAANKTKSTENKLKTTENPEFSFPNKFLPPETNISLQNEFLNHKIAANLNSVTVEPKESFTFSNMQRNKVSKKGETAKKITKSKAEISFEVVLVENNEKLSEIPKILETSTYTNIPAKEINKNSSSQNLRKVFPSKESAKKMTPQFEYLKVPEDIQLSETPVIEFDFSKISKSEKMNNINNNANYHRIQNKIKRVSKKKNNLKHIYSQGNKQIVSDQLTNAFLKQNTVKWNNTLCSNNANETFKGSVSSKTYNGKVPETSCDKFQWKVIHEQQSFFTRENLVKDKDNIKQCCSDEEINAFNYNKETVTEQLTLKDNSCISVADFEYNANNLMNEEFSESCSIKAEKYPQKVKFDIVYDQVINDSTNCQDLSSKSDCIKSKNLTTYKEKNQVIELGKEICDFIIGSYTALTTFFAFYNEWKVSRCELIDQFEQLEKIIKDSFKKYEWYKDLPKMVNDIALVATNIPNSHVGTAAKIVTVISSLADKFFKNSKTKRIYVDESEINRCLLKDIDASYEIYMYGLQCNEQFEETSKLIIEFHSIATNLELSDEHLDPEINTFIQGMLEYNPKHHTFYKKLHKCFQELLRKGSSSISSKFYEPFTLNSYNAVDVIGYLNWRFIKFNNISVKEELEDIYHMIETGSSTSLKDLESKLKNCIQILKKELQSVELCISEVPLYFNKKL